MEKKEISFGAYVITLLLFLAIPALLIWKVLLPVYAHDTPHFYHRGAECHEHQYFFWTGLFVLAVVFGLLLLELFKSYKIKPNPEWWQKFKKAFAWEFSKENPLAFPILGSLMMIFAAVIRVYAIGRPDWFFLQLGIGGLVSLVIFLLWDGWLKQRKS